MAATADLTVGSGARLRIRVTVPSLSWSSYQTPNVSPYSNGPMQGQVVNI